MIWSNLHQLIAGSWQEIRLTYTVGSSGLADGAWIKATFKTPLIFRVVFQTSDPKAANYVSAEYEAAELLPGQIPSTVQGLSVRFDQKGHERPFQKSIIVDIVDGFLNVGDKIHLRLGDRRMGGAGTRVQTFRFRFYVDPVGTSRFSAVPNDIRLQIVPRPPNNIVVLAPRLVQPSQDPVKVVVRAEDIWGNTITNTPLSIVLNLINTRTKETEEWRNIQLPANGWSTRTEVFELSKSGSYRIEAGLPVDKAYVKAGSTLITIDSDSPGSIYYGDLHVHSDDTVGTNDSLYNFSYAKECAGLDVVGYTANDFNVTKDNWDATVKLIDELNKIYPGTEWCGNTAVGGDHNVVFLDDHNREFPYDRHDNVARSFEWNDQMQSDTIEPGTWPIDDLYATYAHQPESHLLIPHIGGRRANLGWNHPKLERLIEVGSAWGHFEWFLHDAISRGYKLGVSANSDEHRGRCGGGIPGTAVFGTRGGLTGIVAGKLNKPTIASALRARHTFATTGQRLVGLTWLESHSAVKQGDEVKINSSSAKIGFRFLGQSAGFQSIKAYSSQGIILDRNLHAEVGYSESHIRVSWGGARVKDRYREAKWHGVLTVTNGIVRGIKRMSDDNTHPEETHWTDNEGRIHFTSSTSGDVDGIVLDIEWFGGIVGQIQVDGAIEGYVKVGDPLKPPPFRHSPIFSLKAERAILYGQTAKVKEELGGVDMFVAIERIAKPNTLPTALSGVLDIQAKNGPHGFEPVWFVAEQVDGPKVWTSPIFLEFP
ncbi:uncharacterized protein L201_003143 [Kwoniella dendrophila CBS 6074]|uniref:DUF3604 domain-containing protein n=1 Tax=Kwoniella dendrophila CBS 6074 TaxID=1295534 RepID=A0AAX4JS13_9TREE